ncbi:unnamed protein product [Schistocephalus solidus]|uniref:VPS13-like middle region domain-containing protein n=1 Tax=Schistocephalus solidus TaxID=70667 RepID=A0A3P7CHP1_SCHSO|nr:unnamed protein product [Schistocephalus solidus]
MGRVFLFQTRCLLSLASRGGRHFLATLSVPLVELAGRASPSPGGRTFGPRSKAPQLLWIDPGVNIFLMQLVIYSRGTNYPEHANNPNKFDMAISLQLGKAHMVVLYRFVQRVLTYLEAFQTATTYAIDKASELSGAAMQQLVLLPVVHDERALLRARVYIQPENSSRQIINRVTDCIHSSSAPETGDREGCQLAGTAGSQLVVKLQNWRILWPQFNRCVVSDITMVQEAVNNPPPGRIALAINVSAPVIYLPQHSHSSRALVFDLGSISLNNHFERLPVPSKGPDAFLMMEMTNLLFEDLRMSAPMRWFTVQQHSDIFVMMRLKNLLFEAFRMPAALLMDGGIKAERHVILPINLQISLKRKVVASMDDGIPLLEVTGVLERIHLQVTHGDYKLINDVMTDNFAEGQPTGAPPTTVISPALPEGKPSGTTNTVGKRPSTQQANTVTVSVDFVANSAPTREVLDKALQFDFILKKIDIELFTGSNSMDSWADTASEDRNLGFFNCTILAVKGQMNKDCSADITINLSDVSLQDTRLVAKQHITQCVLL